MKTETCVSCDGVATITRKNYPFNDMGVSVELQNVEVSSCAKCATEEPIIPNMDGLMLAVATALICIPRKLAGDQVRFLRKFVGKSAADFSSFLHIDPTHLSKIENDKTDIGAGTDKLVRLLVANMSPALKSTIEELMATIPMIEDRRENGLHELQVDPETMSCHYACL